MFEASVPSSFRGQDKKQSDQTSSSFNMLRLIKLLLLLLFIVTVFGQTDTDSSATTDSGDSTDDDSDSISVTGDSDDSDDDDSNDSMSATGDSDDSDDDDSNDSNASGDDSDDDSGDDSDDDSNASGTSSDTDSSSGSGTATTTASTVSYCAQLTSSECGNAYANDGTAICAVNAMSDNCYAVVASQGMYGSGNYDAGYTQATTEMEAESQKLAAIVVLLVLALLGGAYFLHQKTSKMAQIAEESVMTEVVADEKETEPWSLA